MTCLVVAASGCGRDEAHDEGVIVAGGRDGIYVMRPDGSGIRAIAGLAKYDNPVISPDGEWLAVSGAGGTGIGPALYVGRADGTEIHLVSSNAYSPSWSPDSKRLVFTLDACAGRDDACYERYDHVADLGSVGADGRRFRRLTRNTVYEGEPDWSPDGGSIAFEGDAGVYVMNPDGSDARVLVRGAALPEWAPDGRHLLVQGTRLLVVDVETGRGEPIPRPRGPFAWPDWSPDGRRIVFANLMAKSWTAENPLQLWVMNADGTDPHPITRTFGWGPPSWGVSP